MKSILKFIFVPRVLRLSAMTCGAIAALGLSGVASALPSFAPPTYNFTQTTGFVYATATDRANATGTLGKDGAVASPSSDQLYQSLWWGDNANQATTALGQSPVNTSNPDAPTAPSFGYAISAMKVIGFEGVGTIDDISGNNWTKISTIYHRNNAIWSKNEILKSGVIRSYLDFGFGGPVDDIAFTFNETPNELNNGVCVYGNPNGSVCDDIFTFDPSGFVSTVFWYDGFDYKVDFKLGDFVNSTTTFPACDANGCKVWTAENTISRMSVFMEINRVPEPASLALVGLALLGAGFGATRRKNS